MSEFNHEDTGGCAVGLTGKINCWNADSEARFVKAMLDLGKWVEKESGALLGHIKAAITLEDGSGITFNLTDLSNGVEKHGNLEPQEKVTFAFMSAVLDIDEHELKHRMFHAIDDSGIDYELDEHVECHCHDHDHHHHHHHEDGEECDDPECECHHHHHHADEVFTSWGCESTVKFTKEQIENALRALEDEATYGVILRAKGIVPAADGSWIHYDYVPGEPDVRSGSAGTIGRLCVIGSKLNEDALKALFGV